MTRRLLISYLTVTVVVLIMLELPLAIFYRQRELERLTIDVERDAMVMATIYEESLEEGTPLDPTIADNYEQRTGARVVVVDADGVSVVDSDDDTDRDFTSRPEFVSALQGQRSIGTRHSDTLGTDLLYVAVPVASGGTIHGALRMTLDTREVNDRVNRFWIGLLAIAVVVLVTIGGLGWILANSITRPIRRLQVAANRFSNGDLTPTTPDASAPHEVADLERTLNVMAERLDALIENQRAFVADASHQLRTPLTALRLRLENLGSMGSTDADAAEELERAVDETTRLASLVGELLLLARAEQPEEAKAHDLVALTRDRIDTWNAVAELSEVELHLEAPDGALYVSAVPGGIEQVLDNLLDNAIRAAPTGSVVCASVTAGSSLHSFSISDQGSGLSEVGRRHALERFWQADPTSSGSGLGLSIAQAIIETSGGTLSLGDNPPHGLLVTVMLPAQPPP